VSPLSHEAVLIRRVRQTDGDPVVSRVGELALGDLCLCLWVARILQETLLSSGDAVAGFITAKKIVTLRE
jgi:hypothetical protein